LSVDARKHFNPSPSIAWEVNTTASASPELADSRLVVCRADSPPAKRAMMSRRRFTGGGDAMAGGALESRQQFRQHGVHRQRVRYADSAAGRRAAAGDSPRV